MRTCPASIVAAVVVAALSVTPAALAQTLCGRDADCPGDDVCERGTCVSPGGAVAPFPTPGTPTPGTPPATVAPAPYAPPTVAPAPYQAPPPASAPPPYQPTPTPLPVAPLPPAPPAPSPSPEPTSPSPSPEPVPFTAPPMLGAPLPPAPVPAPPSAPAVAAPPPAASVSTPAAAPAAVGLSPSLAWLATLFGEFTPSSSRTAPFSGTRQLGVLTGVMGGAGVLLPGLVRVLGLLRVGYGAAGQGIGKGDDGVFFGGGLLVSLAALPELGGLGRIEPFVRVHLDGRVAQLGNSSHGLLGTVPFSAAAGLLAANGSVEVHATFGGDVAGGTAVGVGLSFGLAK